jgi:hypothetical protein
MSVMFEKEQVYHKLPQLAVCPQTGKEEKKRKDMGYVYSHKGR